MATVKQKLAAKKVVENGGNVSRAMLDVGYDPATANTPQKLTESKGWKELMEQYLPDDKLLKVHDDGLEAVKVVVSPTEPDKVVPDYPTRAKYLELGYKIKGKMSENSVQIANV